MNNKLSKKQIYIFFIVFVLAVGAGLYGVFSEDSSKGINSIEWNENEISTEGGEVLLKSENVPSNIKTSELSEFGVSGPFSGASLSPDGKWIAFTVNGAAHGSGWLYEIETDKVSPVAFQYGGGVEVISWSPDNQFVALNIGTPAPSEYIKVVDRNNIADFATETGTQLRLDEEAGLRPPFSYEFVEWQAPHTICVSLNDAQDCFEMSPSSS